MATSPHMAQEPVWCDLCISSQFLNFPAELHCKPCCINLCEVCAGKHILSNNSTAHDIVEYKHENRKPKYPECQTHKGRKCELECQQCRVPVCALCFAGLHQEHKVAEISILVDSKIAEIMQDNEELEKILAPKYEEEGDQLEAKMYDKSVKYDAIITTIAAHGQDWHKEVDTIINRHTTDVQKDKSEDLGHLQEYLSEIRNTKSLIYQIIEKNKKLLETNNITEVVNYRSRNHEFKKMSPRVEFCLPSFQPIKIQGYELLKQFGTLSASIKSEVEGYTIKTADRMSYALSLKHLLDQSQIITTTDSGIIPLYRMTCVGSNQVWISGHERKIKRVNIRGKLLQKVRDVCRVLYYPVGLSITSDGAVLYCDSDERSVKMVKDKNIHTVITLQEWIPRAVCYTSSEEMLVFMTKNHNMKLVRYSGAVMKQQIQYDHSDRPLFCCSSFDNRYIEENRNEDICIENCDHIVVVNRFGQLRFMYDGNHQPNKYTTFTPSGIATDSKCQILVVDFHNNCVHVIDKDGQFLCYIDNCELDSIFPISVDTEDRLWVGYRDTGKIKVIKYMK